MPYRSGTKTNGTGTVVFAIVALSVTGVLAVLGVLFIGEQSASAERSAAIIAGVFAFITPTVAALLAFLRASDASTVANTAAQAGIVAAEKADIAATTVNTKVSELHETMARVEKQTNDLTDRAISQAEAIGHDEGVRDERARDKGIPL